ncbi:MAG: HNH endonuclease [Bdellovibrionaceae bacterium]|nr:HNH endonuclease [Pseudobdellovibrionaceae bacterium]
MNFHNIPDQTLLSETKIAVQKEKECTLRVLHHLREIEARRLHLKIGFPSLFEYATKDLGYSPSAAYRRIQAMRLLKSLPQAEEKIRQGELNLTVAAKLQDHFRQEDRRRKEWRQRRGLNVGTADLASSRATAVSFETTSSFSASASSETGSLRPASAEPANLKFAGGDRASFNSLDGELAGLSFPGLAGEQPRQNAEDMAPLSPAVKERLLMSLLQLSSREAEKKLAEWQSAVSSQTQEKTRFLGAQQVELKLVLSEELHQDFLRLKEVLSHVRPSMTHQELLARLVKLGLKKWDPLKQESRGSVATKKTTVSVAKKRASLSSSRMQKTDPLPFEMQKTNEWPLIVQKRQNSLPAPEVKEEFVSGMKSIMVGLPSLGRSKAVQMSNLRQRFPSTSLKRLVWRRDQGACTYKDSRTGRVCGSRHQVQVDHVRPFAYGGLTVAGNLRLLCARHNQLLAPARRDFLVAGKIPPKEIPTGKIPTGKIPIKEISLGERER